MTQAEIDAGGRPGTTTAEATRLGELEREVRELRRANAILLSASTFFAAARPPLPLIVDYIEEHKTRSGRADLHGAVQR